ncbi:MAG: tetratricopeptide repeat protein, partial [Deltaproteobacteria bacterium]|nr:tetratricopeptide repeat protein [Deltaproteobacteria bacterium]
YVRIKEFLKALRIYQPLLLKLEEIEVKYRIEVLYNLALIYFMEGEKQKALQYVQRVISIDPQHAEAAGLRKKIG